MKKYIKLFEEYKNSSLVIPNIDTLPDITASLPDRRFEEVSSLLTLHRLLKIPIYQLNGALTQDKWNGGTRERIAEFLKYENILIFTFGVVDITNESWDNLIHIIRRYDTSGSKVYYNLIMDEIIVDKFQKYYEVEESDISHQVERYSNSKYLADIYEYCIKNNIDIGASPEFKTIANAALKGNHKLK